MRCWRAANQPGNEAADELCGAGRTGRPPFSAPEWKQSPIFDYIHQSYLLNARYLKGSLEIAPVEDDKAKNRLRFLARQYLDAVAPSNFAATNPEFIKLAVGPRPEHHRRHQQPDQGFREGPHLDDRRIGVRGRPQPGDDRRCRGLRERELIQLIQYSPLDRDRSRSGRW